MINQLTEQEVLLIAQHRDMEANGRYGELTAQYKAGRLVGVKKMEDILVRDDLGNPVRKLKEIKNGK
jgi:hypothetical protein